MKKAATKSTSKPWTLTDVVDFEYFVLQHSGEKAAETGQHLRHWFQAHRAEADVLDQSDLSDRSDQADPSTLRAWLEEQRSNLPETFPQPGESWAGFMRLLSAVFVLAGLLTGTGVASGLLRYDGVQPVNVALFLGILVVFQTGWNVVSLLLLAGKGSALLPANSGLGRQVCGMSFRWVATRLHRHVWSHLPAEQRLQWESFWQQLSRDHGCSGKYLTWPILCRVQLLGVAFNVGAVLTISLSVMFRDLAFGWQTSMEQLSNTVVASWVKWMALPWSPWLGEGQGYPSPDQIEGSRIILREGIAGLQNEDLTAWWLFLLMCLCVYGLLPRLILWGWSGWLGRRHIRMYPLKSPSAKKLWEQFQTPYLNVTRQPFQSADNGGETITSDTLPDSNTQPDQPYPNYSNEIPCLVMVDNDLSDIIESGDLDQQLLPYGWNVVGHDSISGPIMNNRFQTLPGDIQCVLWIQEAWQPPIMEKMDQMKQCRKTLPRHVLLLVGLIGKPSRETWLTAVRERDFEIWTQFVTKHLPDGTQVKCLVEP